MKSSLNASTKESMDQCFSKFETGEFLTRVARVIGESPAGGLVSDGLVYRYAPQPSIDGLPGEEGTFNMCSFWLVEALTRAGQADAEKLDHARLLFERVLGYANHHGLYSEQTGPQDLALGNFPQAFTHLALISAAFNLDRMLGERSLKPRQSVQ